MKPILLLAFCLTALTAVSTYAQNEVYLPPTAPASETLDTNFEKTAETENDESETTSVLGSEGYMYKTVRKLRARTIRDVSHLNREYLPPVVQTPVTHYLPPIEHSPRTVQQLNNEYLPPHLETETEAATTEAPTTTTTTPIPTTTPAAATTTTTIVETETEAVTEQPATEASVPEKIVEDSAILADDGYHYKKPDVVPDLGPIGEYLPPLNENVIIEETPDNEEESSVLADDGYHYRSIRRFRF